MRVQLVQGFIRNGETIKEVEIKEKLTIGMEEEALDMCISIGKPRNILSAEICSLAVATGLRYDDIRSLHPYDYNLLKTKYNNFFSQIPSNPQKKTEQAEQILTQQEA